MGSSVTPEGFVRAWQGAASLAEVAEKCSMTAMAVSSRAAAYRRMGVPLKTMSGKGGRPKVNVAELVKIAKEKVK